MAITTQGLPDLVADDLAECLPCLTTAIGIRLFETTSAGGADFEDGVRIAVDRVRGGYLTRLEEAVQGLDGLHDLALVARVELAIAGDEGLVGATGGAATSGAELPFLHVVAAEHEGSTGTTGDRDLALRRCTVRIDG